MKYRNREENVDVPSENIYFIFILHFVAVNIVYFIRIMKSLTSVGHFFFKLLTIIL